MTIRPGLASVLSSISLLMVSCSATSFECSDPLGCLEISPDNPVTIGLILANSGRNVTTGTDALTGVERAVEDKAELLSHPIQLLHNGTDCTEDSARLAATDFAIITDLSAVLGPTCAEEMDAASPILMDAGIPLLGPINDSNSAYELTNKVFIAIEQVSVRMPDDTIFIPRQALLEALQPYP